MRDTTLGSSFKVRVGAGVLLAACLFLPFTTCTRKNVTTINIPVRDFEPLALVLFVFCWPVLLLAAEPFVRRKVFAAILLALYPLAAGFSAFMLFAFRISGRPAYGFFLSLAADAVLLALGIVDFVRRVRSP